MASNPEKAALRKVLLEKRDGISYDMIKIASGKIFNKLKQIKDYKNAQNIACYYPIGSEVLTQDILLECLSHGKQVCLPKVVGEELEFRQIKDLNSLEKGTYDIMEPKDDCAQCKKFDVVIVPAVGLSRNGARLGYGYGYYDRFLAKNKTTSIALSYSKQIVKSIPTTDDDFLVDWIVTEDEFFKTL